MKIYQIIATSAMAALVLAGCNKETETPETPDPDAGLKEVTISINGAKMTKGQATPVVEWGTAAAEISKYDIYFTTASGTVKYHYQIASTGVYSDAYNEFKKGGSVRFIGLENISQVYVVANAATPVTVGQNISTLGNLALENYGGDKTKNDILYVGGDKDLTPIESEPDPDVDINVPSDEEMASQYYTAEIYLRPIISRIEIGDVYVQTTGELTETVQTDKGEKTIKYTWTGFTPKLTGIYMSNVAGSLNPMTATVDEWFAKPTGTQIAEGKWSDNITYVDGETFNMAASEMNVKKVLWYSNYASSAYEDLFASSLGETVGNNHYYFNGMKEAAETKTCIPFNFFVPFDVTAESNKAEAAAVWNGANEDAAKNNPALHFQFDFSDKGADGSAYKYQVFEVTSGSDKEITAENNPDLYAQLTSRLNFNTVSDDIYYANVTSFKEGDAPVNVAPNTIYKLTGVGITPFNLATGTEAVDEEYNIIVKVTTVNYIEKNVTPSFDNE